MHQFLEELSSGAPTPGGGGAAALIGAVSASLCSMVAHLTTGKKKYSEFQDRYDEYLSVLPGIIENLEADISKDAEAFAPLAAAYSMNKEDPDYARIMEEATLNAALAPLEITRDIYNLVPIIEELSVIGSRLAISDVAVAATSAVAALESAVMNIYINTKSLKDREAADRMNAEADHMVKDGKERLGKVYNEIMLGLRG